MCGPAVLNWARHYNKWMLIEGMYLPLTTPFYPDGRLNARKLEYNVDRYSRTPAAGLTVLGARQGEASLLTDEETGEALRAAVGAVSDEKVLLAGVSRDSVRATLGLAELAAELRYDAVLVGVPSMLAQQHRKDRKELLLYFQTVADRALLPVVLESGPGERRIPLETAVELARHPGVLGIVESGAAEIAEVVARTEAVRREVTVTAVFAAVTRRMAAANAGHALVSTAMLTGSGGGTAIAAAPGVKTIRTRTRTVGFQVLAGDTANMLSGLRAGASGIAARFAACAPQACHEVYAAWKDGDQGLAEEKQARLMAAACAVEASVGATKFGCDLNGYSGGWPRLPLLPPNGDERVEIERLMQELRS